MKKACTILSIAVVMCLISGCRNKEVAAELEELKARMTLEGQNKAVVLQETGLTHADEKAIRSVHEEFEKTVLEADWDALSEFYAEDAVRMRPGEPVVVGKEAILEALEEFEGLKWEHRERLIKIIEGRGDLAFVWSIYKGEGTYKGSSFRNSGGILQVFRKQDDGAWKVVCDAWNYDRSN